MGLTGRMRILELEELPQHLHKHQQTCSPPSSHHCAASSRCRHPLNAPHLHHLLRTRPRTTPVMQFFIEVLPQHVHPILLIVLNLIPSTRHPPASLYTRKALPSGVIDWLWCWCKTTTFFIIFLLPTCVAGGWSFMAKGCGRSVPERGRVDKAREGVGDNRKTEVFSGHGLGRRNENGGVLALRRLGGSCPRKF